MASAKTGNAKSRAKAQRKPSQCICCKVKPIRCRGLCADCYKSALYQINTGRTTDAALERQGLILPSTRVSPMRKAIEATSGKRS